MASWIPTFFSFLFFSAAHKAYGILVPAPETEPVPWAVKSQSPNHWNTKEFL